jgi:hypothetical protein
VAGFKNYAEFKILLTWLNFIAKWATAALTRLERPQKWQENVV